MNVTFKELVHRIVDRIKNEPYFRWPNKIRGDPSRRNRNLYCTYHRDKGHTIEQCKVLKDHLGCVWFNENAFSSENHFKGNCFPTKENVFRLFGCLGIHFTENQFRCLVRSNILRKMRSVLQKINSHVWFIQSF